MNIAHDQGQIYLSKCQKLQIQNFLLINFEKLIVRKPGGGLDREASDMETVEGFAIKFIQFVQ